MSSWLDKLAKSAQEGVSRATTEADKAIKMTRVTNDIGNKKGELDRAFAVLGALVWELHHKGETLPDGMTEQFATVDTLQQQLHDLEAQREALKVAPPPTAPAQAGAAPMQGTAPDASAPHSGFCGGCGAPLAADAKFCISCGRPAGQ